jgi:hypothetical protein
MFSVLILFVPPVEHALDTLFFLIGYWLIQSSTARSWDEGRKRPIWRIKFVGRLHVRSVASDVYIECRITVAGH